MLSRHCGDDDHHLDASNCQGQDQCSQWLTKFLCQAFRMSHHRENREKNDQQQPSQYDGEAQWVRQVTSKLWTMLTTSTINLVVHGTRWFAAPCVLLQC
jgi:hypothetical protein